MMEQSHEHVMSNRTAKASRLTLFSTYNDREILDVINYLRTLN